MKHYAIGVVAAVAALAAAAAGAHAAGQARAGTVVAGPAFVAGQVAWAERTPGQGFVLRMLRGGTARTVLAGEPEPPATHLEPRLEGGAAVLLGATAQDANVRPGDFPTATSTEHLLVAPDGATQPLGRCEPGRSFPERLPGDGDADATVRVGCTGELLVRETATGTETALPVRGRSPRIAGRFVAFVVPIPFEERGDIVVYDWRASRELYRVPTARIREPVHVLDLRADGAVVFEHPVAHDIAWASSTRPSFRRLRLAPRGHYDVRWHGRAMLFAFDEHPGFSSAHLGLVTTGGRRRILARGVRVANSGFDGDGRRIAYVGRRCGGLRVIVRGVREREPRCRR